MHSPSPSWLAFVAEFLATIGVVDVVVVVEVEGCCEAFKLLLTSTRQKKLDAPGEAGPPRGSLAPLG